MAKKLPCFSVTFGAFVRQVHRGNHSRCDHPAQFRLPHLIQHFHAGRGGLEDQDREASFRVLEHFLGVITNTLDIIMIRTLGKLNQESSSSDIEF